MNIKFLGASGSKSTNSDTTCIFLDKHTFIDAGNIMKAIDVENLKYIDHIYLTHSHLDHIIDIAFVIEATLQERVNPLNIYGNKTTLKNLKKYIFNWEIWPDFSQIPLILNESLMAINFIEIEYNKQYYISENVSLTPIEVNHTIETNGFVISCANSSILFTSDTYLCDNITKTLNENKSIHSLVVDVSFPSSFDKLAKESKHLTPKLLSKMLEDIKRDIMVYVYHLKFPYQEEIVKELNEFNAKVLNNDDEIKI